MPLAIEVSLAGFWKFALAAYVEGWSTIFWALIPEGHARKLLFDLMPLGGIVRFLELIGPGEGRSLEGGAPARTF